MQALIMAGWKPGLNLSIPDSLMDVEGRPFMEYQFELLKDYGIDNIIVCTGNLGANINYYFYKGQDFGVNLRCTNIEDSMLGTGGVIKSVYKYLHDEFYVISGDSYFPINYKGIMQYFIKNKNQGLMFMYRNNRFGTNGNVTVENKKVKNFINTNLNEDIMYTYANTCILNKKIFDFLFLNNHEAFSLEDIFNALIERDELLSYEISQQNIETSTIQGLEKFKEYLNNPVNFL
ncbi:hypothetical protein HY745_01620 [Candidatus Desantisbacteria bacterium]|nr:hypothetical protein [Candidatus Desantisbacteria bacterium]